MKRALLSAVIILIGTLVLITREVVRDAPETGNPVRSAAKPAPAAGRDAGFRGPLARGRSAAESFITGGPESAERASFPAVHPSAGSRGADRLEVSGPEFAAGTPDVVRLPAERFRPVSDAPQFPAAVVDPPQDLLLTEPAVAAAGAVAGEFTDAVDESGEPEAPAYRHRWQREQSVADWRLRAQIGAQAFARWQEEAWLRTQAERGRSR